MNRKLGSELLNVHMLVHAHMHMTFDIIRRYNVVCRSVHPHVHFPQAGDKSPDMQGSPDLRFMVSSRPGKQYLRCVKCLSRERCNGVLVWRQVK